MTPAPTRDQLDRLAEHHAFDEPRVRILLELAAGRPSRAERLEFSARCLKYAGVLSLASALVFFVAANWGALAVFGRFALVEIALVAFAALAVWKPPPRFLGRAAAFLAFMTTGVLLALFGQTYQTGADVHELFVSWALLGLPFALVAQWAPATAAWVLVLNSALALFCGWHPSGGLLWMIFDGNRLDATHAIVAAGWLNIALWLVLDRVRPGLAPQWVRRLVLTCAFGFVTWAGVLGVLGESVFSSGAGTHGTALAGAAIAVAVVGWRASRREDVYPLALVMASVIVVVLCAIPRVFAGNDEVVFLLMALWLIAASAAAGIALTRLMRLWRTEPA